MDAIGGVNHRNMCSPEINRTDDLLLEEQNCIEYIEPENPQSSSRLARKKVPSYKLIENTTFAVDAFNYGFIPGISVYFLTHFHADHYQGLSKSFNKPIYLSLITYRLVREFINVKESFLNVINYNETINIDGVNVTALNANHCPGAIMFSFELPNGKTILHTGDFRATPQMEEEPIFWNNHIHTLYLDTTYLSTKYNFMDQHDSLTGLVEIVKEILTNTMYARMLILIGSYLVGKEKVWIRLAKAFNRKVWLESNRFKAVKCYNRSEVLDLIVDDPDSAGIHVVPINMISYNKVAKYFEKLENKKIFDSVLAIRPSGWEKSGTSTMGSKIKVMGWDYSEHSSYDELKRFVYFTRPKKIYSTVPKAKGSKDLIQIPRMWLKEAISDIKPRLPSNYVKQLPFPRVIRPTQVQNIKPPDIKKEINHPQVTNSNKLVVCIEKLNINNLKLKRLLHKFKIRFKTKKTSL